MSRAVNYSGSYNVGTAGTWTNLTNAFTAISAGTVTGNIDLVLVTGYPAAAETYPIVPSKNNGTYTITIYPGVSGLSITSASATGTINLNGCDNYILDGRVNLTGTTEGLIVANTNTAGYTIEFINDASYNTIQYCNIEGVSTSLALGDVVFSTAASSGNNYNTIQYCDIHDGATTPYVCIYSSGTNTAGEYNNANTISNCNIYNFYVAAGADALGMYISTGNTAWNITNNSFYQTATRTPTAALDVFCLYINNTGIDYVVTGYYVGGEAASCGGSSLSFGAGMTENDLFYGIYIDAGTTGACTVENNTVTNITFGAKAATAGTYDFLGIAVTGGYVVVNGNTVGSSTGTGAVTCNYATTSTAGFVIGCIYSSASSGSADDNVIGSITVSGGSTTQTGTLNGFDCHGALTNNFSISSNTVGSTTTASSIQYATSSTAEVSITGIWQGTTGAFTCNIENNTIENITNNTTYATSGGAVTQGIYAWSGGASYCNIYNNTIATITTTAPITSDLIGINMINTTAGQTIANNTIYSLTNTYAGATANDVYGIYYSGPTTGANSISANAIYGLAVSGTSTASTIYGIKIQAGIATTSNNMITLGNGVATGYAIDGIYQVSATAGNLYYFNSVYIGGTVTAGSNTNCYYSSVTAARTVENNIFYNARSGAATHYSIDVSSKTGLTSNYNDLYSATDAGIINATSYVTLANWQTGSGQDANSISSNPSFNGPTSTPPDLTITGSSSVIGLALFGTGITVDYFNDLRSNPPDIGADEYHTNYYSNSSGNLDQTTSWGINTDGSGANPANFTTQKCTYNIRNNAAPTIGSAWTVSGNGSIVVLGNGTAAINFTIPPAYSFTGTINISGNATLTIQNATVPTLGTINTNSTINYNSGNGVNQTITAGTYGNLIISNSTGSGSSTKSLGGNVSIVSNLTIGSYATFDMVTFNANRTAGGGTLSLASNSTLRLSGTTGGDAPSAGTSSFPNNFASMSLTSGTVEYYGATQTIFDLTTYGNLTISTAGNKTPGGNLTIDGNLLINTGTFVGSTYTIYLGGNWTNNLGFTQNTSTIDFDGSAAQTLSGSAATTFDNLTVNNSSGGLVFDASMTVAGALTFKSTNAGLINLNGNTLTIGTSAAAPGSVSYPNPTTLSGWAYGGTFTRWLATVAGVTALPSAASVSTTGFFPIGSPSSAFEPFWFGQSSTITTGGTITLSQTSTAAGSKAITSYPDASWGNTVVGISNADWVVSYTGLVLSTAASAEIMFGGDGFQTFVTGDINASNAAGTVGTYVAPSQFYGANDFEVERTGLTLAQMAATWYVGTDNLTSSPLPIQLTSFTAQCQNYYALLQWTTATETDNDYFTIDRTQDGINFTTIAVVKGAGTSSASHTYSAIDESPLPGISYYRISQTDLDGNTEQFNTIVFESCENSESVNAYCINDNTIDMQVNSNSPGIYTLTLINMFGQVISTQNINVSAGLKDYKINAQVARGVYILQITGGEGVYNKKLVFGY
ncbi:MAG: beta strand repeat-containing protein [Bacteroidia bacterium]